MRDFNGVIRYEVRRHWGAESPWDAKETKARITAKLASTPLLSRYDLATGRDVSRFANNLHCKPSRLIAYRLDSASEWVEVARLATGDK